MTLAPLAIALLLIGIALVIAAAWMLAHRAPVVPAEPPVAALPDRRLTPGAVDPAVTDADICAHDWAPGDPPQRGGDLTYSKAARHTSRATKDEVFAEYRVTNPHDRGQSWEIDHLVPLGLGGRDTPANLWPESRLGSGMNAWAKDRLEYRLYRLVCDPPPGASRMPLREAQAAFTSDWVAAYRRYCADEADCPAFAGD